MNQRNNVTASCGPGSNLLRSVETPLPGLGVQSAASGSLIVNADDWGRDYHTTQRILECRNCRTISSASAMVFMEDSRRAAELAREAGLDAGLHLNLTLPFSAAGVSSQLRERQRKLANFLSLHSLAQVAYHPGLADSFDYVVKAQLEEFSNLYGVPPARIDGHHHMHLCANVVFGELLPAGTLVRRNFSFQPGEKGFLNRLYRKSIDRKLAKRHRMADYLFSLPPLEPRERLDRIRSLAREFVVEVETHPVNPEEYAFLTEDAAAKWAGELTIANSFTNPQSKS